MHLIWFCGFNVNCVKVWHAIVCKAMHVETCSLHRAGTILYT